MLKNAEGNPYIDLEPTSDAIVNFYGEWSAANITNAALTFLGSALIGAVFMWLYFFIRGQKVTQAAANPVGYAPTPSYPTQSPQNDKETTVS